MPLEFEQHEIPWFFKNQTLNSVERNAHIRYLLYRSIIP